ncbi:hypothetical protein D021_1895A, partial [Vibrio parahaemolyticus 10296]|jgi:NADH-quinone oxidoreductase subunit M
MLII